MNLPSKVKTVFKSCNTFSQLRVAHSYSQLAARRLSRFKGARKMWALAFTTWFLQQQERLIERGEIKK